MANIVELNQMSTEKLREMVENNREELFNLRFQKASLRLENHARVRQVRREVAQIETMLHSRDLAIQAASQTPAVAAALAGRDYQSSARYVYEDSAYWVDFTDKDGKQLASAKVNLNKAKPKGRGAQHERNLVISHEVRG